LAIIVLTINQVLWLKFSSFTGSPIHPPLGALTMPTLSSFTRPHLLPAPALSPPHARRESRRCNDHACP
jgi:hypothetical protein